MFFIFSIEGTYDRYQQFAGAGRNVNGDNNDVKISIRLLAA
jgi:hypothetical protein